MLFPLVFIGETGQQEENTQPSPSLMGMCCVWHEPAPMMALHRLRQSYAVLESSRDSPCTVLQDKCYFPRRSLSPGPYHMGGLQNSVVLTDASKPSRTDTVGAHYISPNSLALKM